MRSSLRSLTREAMIYGLGQALGRMLPRVALVPLFTRALLPAQFGALELVVTLSTVLQMAFISGLDTGLNRFLHESTPGGDRRSLVSTALAWRLGLALLVCVPAAVGSAWMGAALYHDASLGSYLKLSLGTVPATLAVLFVGDYLRMTFRPWTFLAFTVLNSVLYAALAAVLVAGLHRGVSGALVAQLCTDGLFAAVGLYLIRADLTTRLNREWLARLLRMGLPLVPLAVSYWIIQYMDRVFLVTFRGYNEAGLYSGAAKVGLLMSFVIQAFTLAWGPAGFAHARTPEGPPLFARVFALYAWGGSVLAVGLSIFARELLSLGTTAAYAQAHRVCVFLVFSHLLNGTYYVFSTGLALANRTGRMAVALVGCAGLTLLLNFLLVKPYGMIGVGIATLAGYVAATVLLAVLSQREFPCPYPFGRVAVQFLLAGAASWAGICLTPGRWEWALPWKLGILAGFLVISMPLRLVSFQDLGTVLGMVRGRLGPRPAGGA